MLRPERQCLDFKMTNDGLTWSGSGCFIATVGVGRQCVKTIDTASWFYCADKSVLCECLNSPNLENLGRLSVKLCHTHSPLGQQVLSPKQLHFHLTTSV